MVEVVSKPIIIEEVRRPSQSGRPQDVLPSDPLMLEVVDRVANPLVLHTDVSVHLVQENRDERSLPIMAVNDVRKLVRFQHELEGRPAEEGEPRHIVL